MPKLDKAPIAKSDGANKEVNITSGANEKQKKKKKKKKTTQSSKEKETIAAGLTENKKSANKEGKITNGANEKQKKNKKNKKQKTAHSSKEKENVAAGSTKSANKGIVIIAAASKNNKGERAAKVKSVGLSKVDKKDGKGKQGIAKSGH